MHSPIPPGLVYIVGAGPGDPELITVKGLACLRRADVVLYDRLVASELLAQAPQTAELIDVGKAPARHRRSQDEINALLIEKARAGLCVVRLKGGDPFVFGRGGEECQALAEAGLAYEVVPGVSSAVAVPAYAGIPVTHRDFASSFTVVTGHGSDTEAADTEAADTEAAVVDWSGLPASGTLVCLMGVKHLPEIARRLVALGRPATTPAAVIGWGTTGRQSVVEGALADIAERAAGVEPPATIVIGEVVALRQKLDWFGRARFERAARAATRVAPETELVAWNTMEAFLQGSERRSAAVEVR